MDVGGVWILLTALVGIVRFHLQHAGKCIQYSTVQYIYNQTVVDVHHLSIRSLILHVLQIFTYNVLQCR